MDIQNTHLKFRGNGFNKNHPEWIIIHHALKKTCSIQDVHNWHLNNGWAGCGYHYFIKKDGTIQKGRNEEWNGVHTKGKNLESIGICLEGCYQDYGKQTDYKAPEAQLKSLITLTKDIQNRYNIEDDKVAKHAKFANKLCPGNYFQWEEYKERLKDNNWKLDLLLNSFKGFKDEGILDGKYETLDDFKNYINNDFDENKPLPSWLSSTILLRILKKSNN